MEYELRRQAVDRAYREHADDVYRVAFAILRDPEAAADATHDAFAQAFERWAQYDANRPLRPWLHGIVTHAALDALRRRRIRDLFGGASLQGEGRVRPIDVADGAAVDPAAHAVRRRLVDEALAGLRPDARAALVLRHYHGYDYAEIAGFLGTSPGNVGSILSRAHATIRARLTAGARSPSEAASGEPRRAAR